VVERLKPIVGAPEGPLEVHIPAIEDPVVARPEHPHGVRVIRSMQHEHAVA